MQGFTWKVPASEGIYVRSRGPYQGIGRHHRPMDRTLHDSCNSLRALSIDGIESDARQTSHPT